MNRVTYHLEMSVSDLSLIHRVASSLKMSVNEFIMLAILEKIERIAEYNKNKSGGDVNDSGVS